MPEYLNYRGVELEEALARADAPSSRPVSRRLAFAALPLASTAALLPPLFLIFGVPAVVEGMRLAALSCVAAGHLVTLEAGRSGLLEPFTLAVAGFYIDMCFAFPLAYNLDLLHRLPYAGPSLKALESRSRVILHGSPGRKAVTYCGLLLFVALPLAGTGAVGGAFFGRLMGLSRSRTLSGIAVGSLMGNVSLALGAHVSPQDLLRILEHPVFGAIGAAAALAVVGILWMRLRALSRE